MREGVYARSINPALDILREPRLLCRYSTALRLRKQNARLSLNKIPAAPFGAPLPPLRPGACPWACQRQDPGKPPLPPLGGEEGPRTVGHFRPCSQLGWSRRRESKAGAFLSPQRGERWLPRVLPLASPRTGSRPEWGVRSLTTGGATHSNWPAASRDPRHTPIREATP